MITTAIVALSLTSSFYAQAIFNNENKELPINVRFHQHCSCWDAGGALPIGECLPGGFVCVSWRKANTENLDDFRDKLTIQLSDMKAIFKVHADNLAELQKLIENGKIVNNYDNSIIDDELLKLYEISNGETLRIKQGDYDYTQEEDYYVFTVDLEYIK